MKKLKISMLCALLSAMQTLHAQKKIEILENKDFNRMITQDITHAITGESTPVSGLKVDISKPEGTISAMFPLKSSCKLLPDLFSFELKGGVTDKSFSLLKGSGSAASAFEFKPSFHYFLAWGSGSVGRPPGNIPAKSAAIQKIAALNAEKQRILDTIYVVTLLYNHYLENIKIKKPLPKHTVAIADQEAIARKLIPTLLKTRAPRIPVRTPMPALLSLVPQAIKDTNDELLTSASYNGKMISMFQKYENKYQKIEEEYSDKRIASASDVWKKKSYYWVTASPVIRSDKANEYQTKFEGRDSLYFKSDYRTTWGASANLNAYWVWPKSVAVLLRATLTWLETNNLSNLTPYNYETKTSFFQYGSAVTQKTKTGSAYNNSAIIEGTEKQFNLELYILPLKTFIPGGYISASVSNSGNLYALPLIVEGKDDKFKATFEGGFVFNINNRDKDKTYLSILPYFRYDDLTDKIRTELSTKIEEPRKDFQDRNISLGIRVGIPITLPKQSK